MRKFMKESGLPKKCMPVCKRMLKWLIGFH